MGLSPQQPLWRVWWAAPDKVDAWKTQECPQIAKEAKKTGATVYFADEACIRSDHHAGRTWAPRGRSPVVKKFAADSDGQLKLFFLPGYSP